MSYALEFDPEHSLAHTVRMDYASLIKEMLKAEGQTQAELARRIGVTQPTISRWMKGLQQPELDQHQRLIREAERLNVIDGSGHVHEPEEDEERTIPVKGWVGAGAIANYYPEETEYDRAPWIPGANKDTIALEIRGKSMGKLLDRWLVYIDEVRSPVTPDLIGQTCVVALTDGQVLVKKIERNPDGTYNLISNSETEPPIRGVEIRWASKVRSITPWSS